MVTSLRKILAKTTLITITLLLALVAGQTVSAQPSDSYIEGLTFGQQYGALVQQNINTVKQLARQNGMTFADVEQQARAAEKLYRQVLPAKVEWMQGLAAGSGIPYEDILIFNVADKVLTGFRGECTTLMATGKAVAGGKGTIIAKNRDVGINHLSEIGLHQPATRVKGEVYRAAYITIPQVTETYKFVGSRSAGRWGYAHGINEHQVIVADNDAPSRDKLDFDLGLHDNDMVRLVLERARTAREGVEIVASLVERYGQAWNGIMFEIGDPNELWVVEVTGRRWAAKRYVDTVTARSNQYQIEDDYDLAAPDLMSFAAENKWVKPGTKKINFRKVYGTWELYPENNDNYQQRPGVEKLYNTEMRYQRAMELLNRHKGNISAEALLPLIRDHYDTYTLPSGKVINMNQIPFYSSDYVDWYNREWMAAWPKKDTIPVHIYIRGICDHDLGWGATCSTGIMVARPDIPNELGLMLHGFMQPCLSTFVPFYVGIDSVDPRYSTPLAADKFHDIAMKAFGNYLLYHDAVREAFDPYENRLLRVEMPKIERRVSDLLKAGEVEAATKLLTEFVAEQCDAALKAADTALDNMLEASVRNTAWAS